MSSTNLQLTPTEPPLDGAAHEPAVLPGAIYKKASAVYGVRGAMPTTVSAPPVSGLGSAWLTLACDAPGNLPACVPVAVRVVNISNVGNVDKNNQNALALPLF